MTKSDQLLENSFKRTKLTSLFESVVNVKPQDPINMPHWLEEYYRMKPSPAKEKAWEEIKRSSNYIEYFNSKWNVNIHNKTCVEWLVDYRDNYNPNQEQLVAINNKLHEFYNAIGNQETNVYRSLRIDFEKIGIREEEQVEDWVE